MIPSDDEPDPLLGIEKEKTRLSRLPSYQLDPSDRGVLLSDRIMHYCGENFKLITPFAEESLRPAGYDLRVGDNFAIGGKADHLSPGKKITIKPYQVAIIQTFETLNLPGSLIGRWNVRVKRAYQGLLWVGGAQVDPGFRGHLCCPIYNLSTEDVELAHGDTLAMIDFVTTTPVSESSIRFEWETKWLVFEQYPTSLQSGVEEQLEAFRLDRQRMTKKIEAMQERTDNFVMLVVTVIAVLFAGLGILATKVPNEPSFLTSPVWVAAVALYFALRAEVGVNRKDARARKWYGRGAIAALVLAVASMVLSLYFDVFRARIAASELENMKKEIEVIQQKK